MIKLMKYEFRKNLFSKIILLILTAVGEAAYLAGVFLKWEDGFGIGMIVLSLCSIFGIMYMGMEGLITFHRDLNTKQSYMLFLTPHSSYQILGAKVVENGLTIFLTGIFYALLGLLDFTVAVLYIGGVEQLLSIIKDIGAEFSINMNVRFEEILLVILALLAGWIMTLAMGYLAIVLCATVLAGKRLSGLISFVIFLVLNWCVNLAFNHLPILDVDSLLIRNWATIGCAFAVSLVLYLITGWIMERKLSV